MAKTKAPNHAAIALEGVLARWNQWLQTGGQSAARSFQRGARSTEILWTEQQIGTSLPSTVQGLLTWRDGEPRTSRLFDSLTREIFPDLFVGGTSVRTVRLLSHRAIAVFGATEGVIKIGSSAAKLVPILWLPGDARDEESPDDEPVDGDRLIAIDNHAQAMWLFEVAGRSAKDLSIKAPSLANLLDRYLAVLLSGRIITSNA